MLDLASPHNPLEINSVIKEWKSSQLVFFTNTSLVVGITGNIRKFEHVRPVENINQIHRYFVGDFGQIDFVARTYINSVIGLELFCIFCFADIYYTFFRY